MATVAQGRAILRRGGRLARANGGMAALVLALSGLACWLLFPRDAALLARLHFWSPAQEMVAHRIAWYLGTWGDYPTYNLPFAVIVWIYGVAAKSGHWRRVAVVALLGATLAGVFDDCFRLTLGRPRPDTHLADHFYGPSHAIRGGYQSFPSGHAASVVGMAAALVLVEWRLSLLTGLFALGVIWGRMELYRHWPSDVVVGTLVGLYFGLLISWGAQTRSKQKGSP